MTKTISGKEASEDIPSRRPDDRDYEKEIGPIIRPWGNLDIAKALKGIGYKSYKQGDEC
jgi:hypothetical protein